MNIIEFLKSLGYQKISIAVRVKKMQHPDDLDEEKVMKRWREAIQQAPSLISLIFEDGRLKVMTSEELSSELERRNISYDDIEDAIDEAERRKLITIDYKTWSAYFWIPLEKGRRKNEGLQS